MKLKNLLLTAVTALSLHQAQAQDVRSLLTDTLSQPQTKEIFSDTTTTTPDDQIANPWKLTSGYAGQITDVAVPTDDLTQQTVGSSTRIGAGIAYALSPTTTLSGRGVATLNTVPGESPQAYPIYSISISQQLADQLKLSLGNQATPSTMYRPFPVSAVGHFETPTDAQIPGGIPSMRLDIGGEYHGSASIGIRGGEAEYGARLGYQDPTTKDKIGLASRYTDADQRGGLLSASHGDMSMLFITKQTPDQHILGAKGSYVIPLNQHTNLIPYAYANTDLATRSLQSAEAGLLFSGSLDQIKQTTLALPIDIYFGTGYDMVHHTLKGYLMLSMDIKHIKDALPNR